MLFPKSGHSTDRHVAVANSFNLEHAAALGDVVESIINGFQQSEDLRWFPRAGPSCESSDVRKVNLMVYAAKM